MQFNLKASIIIVNYNTSNLVIDCIESIKGKTRLVDYEIIVIDNHSTLEDPKKIMRTYPDIKLFINEKNEGFGRANNIGIKIAVGEYILLLNSDTIVLDHAIDKCISFFDEQLKKNENLGLLGCKLLEKNGEIQKSVFFEGSSAIRYFIHSNPILSRLFQTKHPTFDYNNTEPQQVHGISGAFMLFHSNVFKMIKPFDPDIFMYCEETELCRNRVSKHFKIVYYPEAEVIHLVGKSNNSINMYTQSMLSYALTWYKKGWKSYIIYLIATFVNIPSLILAYIFAGENGKKDFSNQLRGYFKTISYMFFDIPKYPKKWGGRPNPLKYSKFI